MALRSFAALGALAFLTIFAAGCVDLDKTADDEVISAGEEAGFTIEAENTSPIDTSTTANITDALPPQVDFAEDPDNPNCTISGDQGSQVLECTFFLEDPDDTESVHVSGLTGPEDCGTITNTAEFSDPVRQDLTPEQMTNVERELGLAPGSLSGPNGEQILIEALAQANEDLAVGETSGFDLDPPTATITVLCPTLVVDKSPDGGTADLGDTVTFTIVVENEGEGDAFDATLEDQLPAGLDFTTDNPDCSISGSNLLTCDFGDLPAGSSMTVVVSAPAGPEDCGRVLDNTATADASNAPAPASDVGSITVEGPRCEALDDIDVPDVDVDEEIDDRIDDRTEGSAPDSFVFADDPDGPGGDDDDGPVVSTGEGSNTGAASAGVLRIGFLAVLLGVSALAAYGVFRRGLSR